jgi:Preprotein translocase subunit SecA (ATPase, RNA helicase)
MSLVKNAPKTATTIVIRSESSARVSSSRDPYYSLMRRLFQEDATAIRGQKFLNLVESRQKERNPLRTDEWEMVLEHLDVSRASFYSMRNKLTGAGLITVKNKKYMLSGQFSKDLMDMARWWWTAILENSEEALD